MFFIIVYYLPYLFDFERLLLRTDDFFRIFDHTPTVSSKGGIPIPKEDIKGAIKFDKVFFNYPNKPAVKILTNMGFEVKAG